MKCEQVRALLLDELVQPMSAPQNEDIDRHIDGCDQCAAEAAELRKLWGELEGCMPTLKIHDGLARLRASVREEFCDELPKTKGGEARDYRGSRARLAMAAVFLVALGALFTIATELVFQSEQGSETVADKRPRYLLIMTATEESPEQSEQLGKEMQHWIGGLMQQGIVDSIVGLAKSAPMGAPPGGSVLNRPTAGFIVVFAPDAEAARRIAESSPAHNYGGYVEVREIN